MKDFFSLATKVLIPVFLATMASTAYAGKFEFGVIGDVPYNDAREVELEALLTEVGKNNKVRFLVHAGDFKSGSTECTDALFSDRRAAVRHVGDALRLHHRRQ